MAIDERARHDLYLRLEEHLGPEAASTLMEHLPPTGWADVATKRDLDHWAAISKTDLDHWAAISKADLDHWAAISKADLDRTRADLERSIEHTRAEFHKAIATHTVVIVFATMATSIASVFAAAQLH